MKNFYTFLMLVLLSTTLSSQSDLINGEYYWNSDPGIGLANAFTVSNPNDTINETFTVNVPAVLPKGQNALFVRYQDDNGVWGQSKPRYFINNTGPDLVSGEYYWNTDPGIGQGTSFVVSNPTDPISETISVAVPNDLGGGAQALYIRVQDNEGTWSIPKVRYFISTSSIPITEIEYYWDTDPGFGNGISIPLAQAAPTIEETAVIDITSLPVGVHTLVVRVRDESGTWSNIKSETFLIASPIYVDESATGTGTGADWVNAFPSFKDALDATVDTLPSIIRVAEGTYYADEGTGDRDSSFVIKSNTTILAGFPAGGDIDGNRDPELYEVILSGDIGVLNTHTDNSYHVVKTTSGGVDIEVDGVIIEHGYADGGGAEDNAGGWLNDGKMGTSNPTIKNTIFRDNYALDWGGAMFNDAIAAGGEASSKYFNCVFQNNSSGTHGGAILNFGGSGTGISSPEFTNCSFIDNTTSTHGGALLNDAFSGNGNIGFTNCIFVGNAAGIGGAMSNFGNVDTDIINCSFAENAGGTGEHIASTSNGGSPNIEIINTLFDDLNQNGNSISNSSGTVNLSYSIIDGPLPSNTNDLGNNLFNTDPLYIDVANNDLNISVNSPATNIGNNEANTELFDIAGNTRIQNSIIDLGAYEVFTDTCQIIFTASGSCAGSSDLLTGDSIITSFTSLNGNGPFDIQINNTLYSGLMSGDTVATFREGVDFSGTPPYSYTLELQMVSDQGNGCINNMDTIDYNFNVIGQPQLSVDDMDGQFCDGQAVSYSVSPSSLGNYQFFNDLNLNDALDTGELLQSGASNLLAYTADINIPQVKIMCISGSGACTAIRGTALSTVIANPVASITTSETSGLIDNDNILCFADTLFLQASGGNTYLWDNGDNTANVSRVVASNLSYQVTVTSSSLCTDVASISPSVDHEIQLSLITLSDISCNGQQDGSIEVQATGGVGNFVYDIGLGSQASGLFTGLADASYVIEAMDQNTCVDSASYTIVEPSALLADFTVQNEQCYQDSSGQITANPSGGTPPFMHSIGGAFQSSPLFSNLSVGTYTLVTQDARACTDTTLVNISGFDSLDISITSTVNASCSNGSSDGSAFFSASGGQGPYLYNIGNGYQSSPSFTGLSAGPYTLTVKDANDCEKALSFAIGSQSLSATFSYSANGNYVDKVVSPESGSQYQTYRFEINFTDPNNELPQATYPRLFLDFEGNGIYNNTNDRIYFLSQADNSDIDVTDGKIYFTEAVGLPISSNWKAYFVALDANGCEATFGPIDAPDVLANPNVSILASDITFSETNPDTSSFFNVFATIHNTSSFDAVNFEVALLNQYSNTYEDTLSVPLLEAGESLELFWDVQAPNEDAWVSYQVLLDVNDDIDESNELDNTASKAIIVGNFSLPVEIIFLNGPSLNPQSGYPCTNRSLNGKLVYTGVPGLQDSTVKGGEVTVTFDASGESFTTFTDNNGNFSLSIYSPINIGTYSLTGYVSDQTLTTVFSVPDITVIPNPPSCVLPDLVLGHTVSKTVVNVGDTLFGTFTVLNVGCVPSNDTVTLMANFTDANESVGPFTVYNLGIGEDTVFHWFATYSMEQTVQFVAHADDGLELVELEEGNNYTSRTIAVANKSNLETPGCQSISLTPATALVGTSASLSFPIKNNSLVNIQEDINYEALVDGITYPGTLTGGLNSNSSSIVNLNITVPNPANSTVVVTIDPNNEIGEKNENDNVYTTSLAKDFSVVEKCQPPGVLSFWEQTQSLNQFVDLSIGIQNNGFISGDNVGVRFEVMGPGYPSWTLIEEESIALLNRTCFCPISISPSTPFAFSQEGVYQIRISVDADNNHVESDEANNVMIQTVNVQNIPDLRMLSAFINPSDLNPSINESISFNITYENIGQENIMDTFDLKVSLDGIAIDSQEVYGLAADDFTTVSMPQSWSSTIVGGHVIEAFIDSKDEIAELSESNNQGTRAIIVGTAPNLYFVDFRPSDTLPDFGEEILVQSVIGNDGDAACSAILELYYLNNAGDTLSIGSRPIQVGPGMSQQFSLGYTVDRAETYILGRILPGTPSEYNLVDNEATFFLEAGEQPCNLLVTNTNNSGEGSLRQCIECANESDRFKTIRFDIPGVGPHIINVVSDLPQIVGDSTQLDGSTQSGNFPMAGEIVLDITGLTGINKTALVVNAKNVGIYGIRFINENLFSNRTGLFFALGSDSLVVGDSMRGNWFTEDKWQSCIFIKENINQGVIQGNLFKSDSLRLSYGIIVTPGTNRLLIGGDSTWMKNEFFNCTLGGLRLSNNSNDNKIVNNDFISNKMAIQNVATGFNKGNQYLNNRFLCNESSIVQEIAGNNGITPPSITYSKVNFVAGFGDPNALIEIYVTPDTCSLSVDCQGERVLHRDTCGVDGSFFYAFDSLLTVGQKVSAIQTDLAYSGSSTFSACSTVDSSCVDFVYSCDDEIVGSLRSAIDCATNGDTIYFLSYLMGDQLMLEDTLLIDKDISVFGLGNPGLSLVSTYGDYVIKIANGKEVVIKDVRICVNDTGASSIMENFGKVTFENVTLIDKRTGLTLPSILNHSSGEIDIKTLLESLKE